MKTNITLWTKLYDQAKQIFEIAPWEVFDEIELFAIRTRRTTYFVSTMGGNGQHFALAFYEGAEALAKFLTAQDDDLPERLRMENLLTNPHLQLSFEPRAHVEPEDRAILKAVGKSFRGRWPLFRSHRPARMPWFLTGEEASEMEMLLEQTLVVLEREMESPDTVLEVCDSESFFLREQNSAGEWEDSRCEVDDLPVASHVLRANLPRGVPDGLSRSPLRLELDLALMPFPVADVPKGEAPYFPLVLMLVDSASGMILGMELLPTKDGLDAGLVLLPDAFARILRQGGILPACILARHPILLSLLEAFEKAYGIPFEFEGELPAVSEALESLLNHQF